MARFVRESLEALLTKILAHDDDWVNIKAFCAEVLKDNDLFDYHESIISCAFVRVDNNVVLVVNGSVLLQPHEGCRDNHY